MPVAAAGSDSVKLRLPTVPLNFSPSHVWPVWKTFTMSLCTAVTAVYDVSTVSGSTAAAVAMRRGSAAAVVR